MAMVAEMGLVQVLGPVLPARMIRGLVPVHMRRPAVRAIEVLRHRHPDQRERPLPQPVLGLAIGLVVAALVQGLGVDQLVEQDAGVVDGGSGATLLGRDQLLEALLSLLQMLDLLARDVALLNQEPDPIDPRGPWCYPAMGQKIVYFIMKAIEPPDLCTGVVQFCPYLLRLDREVAPLGGKPGDLLLELVALLLRRRQQILRAAVGLVEIVPVAGLLQ